MSSLLSFLILIAVVFGGLNASLADYLEAFKSSVKSIIVDVRGSRGGHGDVAAGYLTIMDMIENYGIESEITVLVDEESRKILTKLAHGNTKFWRHVEVVDIEKLSDQRAFNLYMALASPSGSFRYATNIREGVSINHIATPSPNSLSPSSNMPTTSTENSIPTPNHSNSGASTSKKIPIAKGGVLIVQTVLGNTENPNSINPYAIVRSRGVNYSMSPAGLGQKESGIYNDYVTNELRGKTLPEIEQYILQKLPEAGNSSLQSVAEGIIKRKYFGGAKLGLAYGISAGSTKPQFMTYLKGLARETPSSFCLVTPSRFNQSDIQDPYLKSKVKVLRFDEPLPEKAEPGKIYVVSVPTLPHKVFVGFMALSMAEKVPPVGAGDGFMSAAINLGGPFLLTRVGWNATNIENLRILLLKLLEASKRSPYDLLIAREFINQTFKEINFETALGLNKLWDLFAQLGQAIPNLTEKLMQATVLAQSAPQSRTQNGNPNFSQVGQLHRDEILQEMADSTFQASLQAGGIRASLKPTISKAKSLLAEYLSAAKDHIHKSYGSNISNYIVFEETLELIKLNSKPIEKELIIKQFKKILDEHEHSSKPPKKSFYLAPNTPGTSGQTGTPMPKKLSPLDEGDIPPLDFFAKSNTSPTEFFKADEHIDFFDVDKITKTLNSLYQESLSEEFLSNKYKYFKFDSDDFDFNATSKPYIEPKWHKPLPLIPIYKKIPKISHIFPYENQKKLPIHPPHPSLKNPPTTEVKSIDFDSQKSASFQEFIDGLSNSDTLAAMSTLLGKQLKTRENINKNPGLNGSSSNFPPNSPTNNCSGALER